MFHRPGYRSAIAPRGYEIIDSPPGSSQQDLKPSNLFLCGGEVGAVKLLDFGIARRLAGSNAMTHTGFVVGTPEYMAPEQARGLRELTAAADLFSLGCVLYECLAGEPPFTGEHIAAVLVRILFEEPAPLAARCPGIPAALDVLVRRMLAKDPLRRIADVETLLGTLAALGDIPELSLVRTVAAPVALPASFAESEQVLFSVVVASLDAVGQGSNGGLPAVDSQTELHKRQALLSELLNLGVQADYVVSGSLVATVPQIASAIDQVSLAARVALLIRDRWPHAAVAVATGRGVVRGPDAVGAVADRAAGMLLPNGEDHAARSGKTVGETAGEAAKETGGIWLDELSARLLGPRFAVRLTRRGAQLLGEEREADASRPLLGKPTPCVGRDAELATLEAQLTSCIEDSAAQAVLITAPPGIGKSRLRHEFLRRVEKRADAPTIFLGRGDLISAGAPYAILGQAIRRLCGLSGSEPLAEQRDRLRQRILLHLDDREKDPSHLVAFIGELSGVSFAEAVEDEYPALRAVRKDPKALSERIRRAFLDWVTLECRAAPVLLVLDDLQWADALTIALVAEALRELEGLPLFVLALARPEVHATFPRLRQSMNLSEIPLKGLSRKACERLIQKVLGPHATPSAVARIIEQSAGNALFLEELIRALSEEGTSGQVEAPETVVAMLQARIGRFDTGPRRAVRAAAVFGQTFWSDGVAEVLGLPRKTALVDSWLAALNDAEVIERRADSRLANEQEYGFRHALVADAAYGLLTAHDLLTGHRLAAGFLESAGEREPAVIAEHYQRGGEAERAAPLYLQAGDEAERLGSNATARRYYALVADLLEKLPAKPALRRLHAEALIRQTSVSLTSDTREQNLKRLSIAESFITAAAHDPADSEPSSWQEEDTRQLARTHYFMGRVNYYGGYYQEAIALYQEALHRAYEIDDRELAAVAIMGIGTAKCLQGHPAAARQLLSRALSSMRELGNELELARAQIWLGWSRIQMGEYREGMREIEAGEALAAQLKQPRICFVARVLQSSGHRSAMDWPATLAAVADFGAAMAEQGEISFAALAWSLEAWAYGHLGQWQEAAAVRSRSLAISRELGGSHVGADWFAASDAEAALLSGTPMVAQLLAESVISTSKPALLLLSWGIAERVCGAALSRLDRPLAEAEAHLAASLRILTGGDLILEAAQTELWWGLVLSERGNPAAAQSHFYKALAAFTAADCPAAVQQVRSVIGGPQGAGDSRALSH